MPTQKDRVTLAVDPDVWDVLLKTYYNDPEVTRTMAHKTVRSWMMMGFRLRDAKLHIPDERMVARLEGVSNLSEEKLKAVDKILGSALPEATRGTGRNGKGKRTAG